jgi:hypothetical protein
MTVLTWNTAGARGTAAAVALADRLRADVVLLQEAHPTGVWPGPLLGAAVAGRPWGSWILVRRGELHDIALPHYAGWVAGAQWRRAGHGGTLFLFSIQCPRPTPTNAGAPMWRRRSRSWRPSARRCPRPGDSSSAGTSMSSRSANGWPPNRSNWRPRNGAPCTHSETRASRSRGAMSIRGARCRRPSAGGLRRPPRFIATGS